MDRLTAVENAIMEMPARTLRGLQAKAAFYFEEVGTGDSKAMLIDLCRNVLRVGDE
jgi:hypothetical protein